MWEVLVSKTRWSILILNILLSVATINYIFEVTYESYDEKSAIIAASLWAFLPYPVIFSCFAYKDSLVAFCLVYLISKFVTAKKNGGFSPKLTIGIILVSLIFLLTRSGISELFICMCLLYYFSDKIHQKIRPRYLFLIFLEIIVVAYVLWKNYGIILEKYQAYVTPTALENTGLGTLVKVSGVKDIWKLPLAYVFAILQPIGLDFSNISWYEILCAANFVMCPISIAAVFGLKKSIEQNKSLFWLLLIYYLIVISSSILIFRHLFHALPIPIIFASNYLSNITSETALPYGIITVLLLACMFVVFI